MNVQVVVQTGVGASKVIVPLSANPFNVGFGAVVTGTVTYTIEHTFDSVNWFDNETVVGQIDNQDGNIILPVAGIRINITAGTGTVTLTTIQAKG